MILYLFVSLGPNHLSSLSKKLMAYHIWVYKWVHKHLERLRYVRLFELFDFFNSLMLIIMHGTR